MSNRLSIRATEFKNVKTGEITYGYVIYDTYLAEYCDILDKNDLFLNDAEFLDKAWDFFNEEALEAFDHAMKTSSGMEVNGTYYDWKELGIEIGE